MISDAAIISAANCPPEIARCGDLPWHFLGEIGPLPQYGGRTALCGPCNRFVFSPTMRPDDPVPQDRRCTRVDMPIYHFVNDDLLLVRIWFGQCEKCQSVYWARQGPPYKRLSHRTPVEV